MIEAQGDQHIVDPSSVRIMKEYMEVFPEELSGLLPERDLIMHELRGGALPAKN